MPKAAICIFKCAKIIILSAYFMLGSFDKIALKMSDWYQMNALKGQSIYFLPGKATCTNSNSAYLHSTMAVLSDCPVVPSFWLWWIVYQCLCCFFVSMENRNKRQENTLEEATSLNLGSSFMFALSKSIHCKSMQYLILYFIALFQTSVLIFVLNGSHCLFYD